MNWEAIGAIGETLGSVAVLITLIYLAYQVRHARSEFRLSVAQHRFDTHRSLTLEMVQNPALARIEASLEEALNPGHDTLEALEEAANLTAVERKRYRRYQGAWFMYRIQTIEQIDQLSIPQRNAFDSSTGLIYSTGIGGLWFKSWRKNGPGADNRTAAYIENLISKRDNT